MTQPEYVIEFMQPDVKIISENEFRRAAFSGRNASIGVKKRLALWKDAAFYAWKEQRFGPAGGALGQPCNVTIEIGFHTHARRDPHNYVGTVCKSVIDGLVHAGLWPDDNPEWVTVMEPVPVVHERTPHTTPLPCRVRLTPREG